MQSPSAWIAQSSKTLGSFSLWVVRAMQNFRDALCSWGQPSSVCCILQKGSRSQLQAERQLLTMAWFNHSAQAGDSCFYPWRIRVVKSGSERFQRRKKSAVLFPVAVQADSSSTCCRHSFGGSQWLCPHGVVSLQHEHTIRQQCRTGFWMSSLSSTAVDKFFPNW